MPFCRHRCPYCDFTLVSGRDELISRYLAALEIELASLPAPVELDTLYLGGGTPTHLSPEQLERLFELLAAVFRPAAGYEFSIEANPADLSAERIAAVAAAGVNRVSLGVQSFDGEALRVLERDHRPQDVSAAVERLRAAGLENLSFDLIFGVPGHSLASWQDTLRRAVELAPRHVSTYGLTIERGTSFWSRQLKGQLVPVADELEREMYALAMDYLPAHGLEQYELSSFAQPGFRCRHNEVYWTGLPYYGFGPGAARYVDGRRETNHRSVTTWLKRVLAGIPATGESEQLSAEGRARELAVLGLRRTEGLDLEQFRRGSGCDLLELAGEEIGRHLAAGLLEQVGTRLRLTREGRFLADTVIVDLL